MRRWGICITPDLGDDEGKKEGPYGVSEAMRELRQEEGFSASLGRTKVDHIRSSGTASHLNVVKKGKC